MVPGMTFSTDFITSIVTYQEKQKLDYTYKIKNYKKVVLVKKAGEIRALNIGDAVVTALFESFAKKPVKSRPGGHRRLENNPEITHGILCRYYM